MLNRVKNIFSTPKPDIILYVIFVFFLSFFIWAAYAELEEVTRGNGKLIASSKLQVIQNLEGGIINDIAVNTGDQVAKGDLLIKLDETKFLGDLNSSKQQLIACLLYTSPSPRDPHLSRMPSSA